MSRIEAKGESSPGTAHRPFVAISILNWNGWRDTLECLKSVRRLDYPNYLTVVVDNGSWNGSAEKIKAWAEENFGHDHVLASYTREAALKGGDPQIEEALESVPSPAKLVLIRNEENLGFAEGNNVAIHYALGRKFPADYILLLNNDALVEQNMLTTLVAVAQTTGAGTTGALVEEPHGRLKHPGLRSAARWLFSRHLGSFAPFPQTVGEFWESPSAHGGAMMISASALRDVHSRRGEYLKAALFMYHDDFEFLFQSAALGYKTVIARRARVLHKVRGSSADGLCRTTYYLERNSIWLANLVLSPALRLLFHLENLILVLARLLAAFCRGRSAYARAIVLGVVDGYRGRTGKWKYHDRPGPTSAEQ